MRFGKISPKVAFVTARRKELTDKEALYPETTWPAGHFDELIRRGFIYEVFDGTEKKINNPSDAQVEEVPPADSKESDEETTEKKEDPKPSKKGKK